LGFDANTIYPFGYFRSSQQSNSYRTNTTVELVFIGQLIRRKGIDILLKAMAPLWQTYPNVRLSVIGSGPERGSILSQVQQDRVSARVLFEGPLPSSHIIKRLARASALVLPSRWDGWGLVVNEALSVGVPVIASDHCGAADLIVNGVNGYIFRSEDVCSLRTCLCAFLNAERKKMQDAAYVTGSALTIPIMSQYMLECLEHMCELRKSKPIPPWQEALLRLRPSSPQSRTTDYFINVDTSIERSGA
jgi:glycosyltransferase involved in cell wall biosynthesis